MRPAPRQGMKVDDRSEKAPARRASEPGRFQELLQKKAPARGEPPPLRTGAPPAPSRPPGRAAAGVASVGGTRAAPPGPPLLGAEHLRQVRQTLSAEAHRLREVRSEAHHGQREQVHQRVTELIARELAREPPLRPEPVAPTLDARTGAAAPPPPAEPPGDARSPAVDGMAGARGPAQAPPSADAHVQDTLALIEKIELFVKSHRPALALQLGGPWKARVEVERTGSREVALRIHGDQGPVPARELSRLREALEARGLKLSALHPT